MTKTLNPNTIEKYGFLAMLNCFTLFFLSMFRTKTHEETPVQTQTLIGPGITVEGNFMGAGDVTIQGSLVGTLQTTKNVHIGPQAKVSADITANDILIEGAVSGNVKCYGTLQLKSTAVVEGNMETNIIAVELGAQVKGKCASGVTETMPEEIPFRGEHKEKVVARSKEGVKK